MAAARLRRCRSRLASSSFSSRSSSSRVANAESTSAGSSGASSSSPSACSSASSVSSISSRAVGALRFLVASAPSRAPPPHAAVVRAPAPWRSPWTRPLAPRRRRSRARGRSPWPSHGATSLLSVAVRPSLELVSRLLLPQTSIQTFSQSNHSTIRFDQSKSIMRQSRMDPTVSHAERTQRRARMRALLLHAAKARAPDALTLSKEKPLFAPYSPSPDAIIHAVWAFLETQQRPLTSADRLVDLGCGDGRWLISGVQRYNCSALGIELDPALVERAKQNVHLAELAHLIDVIQADIMATDITNATFVIVYAFAESLSGIREYLEKQLSKQASVLSIGFRVPEWKPEWSDRVGGLRWYLYDIKSLRG